MSSKVNKVIITHRNANANAGSAVDASRTFANRLPPQDFGAGLAYFSDLGVNGTLAYSDGSQYLPIGPITLLKFNGQILVPSLNTANAATYSQSGNTLTVSNVAAHSIPDVIYNGATVYLAIGTISTGVAPSAAFANFFTNFQYVNSTTFTCQATNSQTGTGVVNTNLSPTVLLPLSTMLPADFLNVGDVIGANGVFTGNSTGTKTVTASLNGNGMSAVSSTSVGPTLISFNNGLTVTSADRQLRSGSSIALNLASTLPLSAVVTCSSANIFACLENLAVELNRSPL